MRRLALAAVLAAFGIAVAVAGAQDFTFSAVAKDGGLPVGVGIANRGVTGAGTQLLALDSNPPGVRIWNAGAYGSSSFYPTNVGAVSSLAVLPGLAGGDGVVVLGAAGVALGSAGAGGLTFRATPFNAFDAVDVAVGDFNGDGLQDIAFVEPQEGNVGVALNGGAGAFLPPRAIGTGIGNLGGQLEVGDFNRDGDDDIVVSTSTGIVLFVGLNDGTFGLPLAVPLGSAPTSLAAADIDLDGLTDLAVGEAGGIEVLHNRSAGGTEVFSGTFLAAGAGPIGALTADLNNDKIVDVLALNRGSGTVSAFIASSQFTFDRHAPVSVGPLVSVSFGRMDDDPFQDIAVAESDGLHLFLGTGGKGEPGGGDGTTGTLLPFVPTPNGPGSGHKRTPNERITPPKPNVALAAVTGEYFWDINVPVAKKPLACGLFDAKTNRQIRNPLFPGVKQKLTCTATHRTRVVHGEKKQIVRIALDLTVTKPSKGSATVWAEVFWK